VNASQKREVLKLYTFHRLGMLDVVARSLSALIRSCATSAERRALMDQADVLEVTDHAEFII
jgi:hypothetical protein